MEINYTKKIFGTAAVAIFLLALTLTGFSFAAASSSANNRTYTIDGVVKEISGNTITVKGSNSKSVDIIIDNKTTFTQHNKSSDIKEGTTLNAKYKTDNGRNFGQVIKIKNEAGYGNDDGGIDIENNNTTVVENNVNTSANTGGNTTVGGGQTTTGNANAGSSVNTNVGSNDTTVVTGD